MSEINITEMKTRDVEYLMKKLRREGQDPSVDSCGPGYFYIKY